MSGHQSAFPSLMLLVALLASSSAGYSGRALQFAPATCTAGANPCEHQCKTGKVDLSHFKTRTPPQGFYTAEDIDSHSYYFDACGPISKVTCEGSTVTMGPIVVQTYGDPPPQPPDFPQDSCAALGKYSTQACHFTGMEGKGNFTCDYSDGDGSRTVSILYTCAETFEQPTAAQPDPMASPPHYVITFAGPSMCMAGGGAHGTSWGTLFMILFPLSVALYFGGGYYYNHKYRDMHGVEAVPQIDYWKQLPGLVKDGCAFSYEQTCIFIAWAREKYNNRGGADAGLKQALAQDEPGESASYEERPA